MDFLKVFVIISFIIVTILTLKFHPEMHHPLIIEDEHFKLTRISDNLPKNMPVNKAVNVKEIQTVPKQSEINIQQSNQQITKLPVQQTQSKKIKTKTTNINLTQPNNDINNEEISLSQMELLKQILNNVTPEQDTLNPNSTLKNPYMTEQEEIIAWNKWRSNVQNQIMRNSNIEYAPLGTMFTFNFVVDKFGNVSNIKVDCSNPNYMDVARNNVKTAISKLQKQPILNFPKGTQRKSTVVQGYFFIGLEKRYSTPNNFSDFERITY